MDIGAFGQTAIRSAGQVIYNEKFYTNATVNGVNCALGAIKETKVSPGQTQRAAPQGYHRDPCEVSIWYLAMGMANGSEFMSIHRDSLHSSDTEPMPHFTVMFFNKDGKSVTGHMIPNETEDERNDK
ncbi:hypothetical protein DPSP01_007831 [Paraphaeosphaeria sporulosa]